MENINIRTIEAAELRSQDAESRKLTFVASDGTRDSAHTVLNPEGWNLDRYNKNGIIGYQHKVYGGWDDTDNPDNVIGKGRAYTEDGKLMVEVEFEPASINPLAEKVYQKLLFGSLKAVSVGFAPVGVGSWGKGEEARGAENETYYYAGQELLEVSVVNIPANPNALRRAFDEANAEEQKRIRSVEEPETIAPEVVEESKEEEPLKTDGSAEAELKKAIEIARAASL